MILVHKIELSPNNKQKTYFLKACGIARFAYNWALAQWQKQYAEGKKPNEGVLRKEFNIFKKQFPWIAEVTKVAPQQAIKNLGNAFIRFFSKKGKHPRFKKKGLRDSFRADNGPSKKGANAVEITGKKIKLSRIGSVSMKEKLRLEGQIVSVTISRRGDRWYAAISVDCNNLPHERKNHGCVGVDAGVTTLATVSNGERFIGSKAHKRMLKKLRKQARALARKKRGSKNYARGKLELSITFARTANIRNDELHKLTTYLALNNCTIGIEDLNVRGMSRNRRLSRSIMDQGFYEFRRQLAYKCIWYKGRLVVVDRFYPSSKLCSVCGYKNTELKLSDRVWTCVCGVIHDRDLNAAVNIMQQACVILNTASYAGIQACGAEGSGHCFSFGKNGDETVPCLKQEFSPLVNFLNKFE